MNAEKDTRNFEIKKLLIGALVTFLLGLTATAIWKWYDRKPDVIYSFVLTINPSNGTTVKTLYVDLFKEMTGVAKYKNEEYEISNVTFIPEDQLKMQIMNFQSADVELNGNYDAITKSYSGVIINQNSPGIVTDELRDWKAVQK